jgi:hypothetical protein
MMDLHPDEAKLARSLRELVLELETGAEDLETRLGWEDDRLAALLDGQKGWTVEEVFEVLAVAGTPPADFFGRVYGPGGRETEVDLVGVDRGFEESQRVVHEAVLRRLTWKRERSGV